ncbi:unnamed protein product [Mytilus coruscus]|uniref:protein-tyrosine-phosphatase n=1 Tax=Mytilus coruscus TaxID=42192 RepID=A0A6J8BR78_MYTCO|nr:unnamed protein product [Mytilus coruscus]
MSYPAYLAIEGPANNNWNSGCSSTENKGHATAWWSLHLPRLAYITNITIYYRSDKPVNMDAFRLYLTNGSIVGDKSRTEVLCYRESDPAVPHIIQNVPCNMTAKRVFFFNRRNTKTAVVELCYIAIHGCWKGRWGTNCTKNCPAECINQDCFPGNGSCVWGCDLQKCFHGTCDVNTGVCTKGCVNGRGGRYCTHYNVAYLATAKQSPNDQRPPANLLTDGNSTSCISLTTGPNSYLQIYTGSLSVITVLYFAFRDVTSYGGLYIVYCSNTSDYLTGDKLVHNGVHVNNNSDVFDVCRYVTYVPLVVNENSQIELCEIEIGGCPYGKYGVNCDNNCSENCAGPCDLKTGNCLFGCLDGWTGNQCKQACNAGSFGGQCLRTCSVNCLSSPCYYVTGECKGGCLKGWKGTNCTEECENGKFGFSCLESCDGCLAKSCNPVTGVCKDTSTCNPGYVYGQYCNKTCADWLFGTNCRKTCNCRYNPCDKFTGKCSADGCKRGWHGESCEEECSYGYFGFNCMDYCEGCVNKSCDIYDGNCTDGCVKGYSGYTCDKADIKYQESSSTNPGPAIGGGMGAAILVILIIIVAIIMYRRRLPSNYKKHASNSEHRNSSNENPYMNQERNEYVNVGCVTDANDITVSVHERASRMSDVFPTEDGVEDEFNVYNNVPSKKSIDEDNILIGDLKHIIEEKQKNESFKEEYEILPKGLIHPHMEGSKDENKIKNRFLTTWPYDHSRVVLVGDTKHDYINASYIDSYDNEKAYIASQGPKKNTVRDFWHMVWQEKTGKIVMVTQIQEERRRKCEQYWPQEINRPMVVDQYKLTMRGGNNIYHLCV